MILEGEEGEVETGDFVVFNVLVKVVNIVFEEKYVYSGENDNYGYVVSLRFVIISDYEF